MDVTVTVEVGVVTVTMVVEAPPLPAPEPPAATAMVMLALPYLHVQAPFNVALGEPFHVPAQYWVPYAVMAATSAGVQACAVQSRRPYPKFAFLQRQATSVLEQPSSEAFLSILPKHML